MLHLTSVVIIAAVSGMVDGEAADSLTVALSFMKHHAANIRSAQVEYRVEWEEVDPHRPEVQPITRMERQVFLWKDKKRLLRSYALDDEGNPVLQQVSAWDGEKQYGYTPSIKQGFIQSQPERPAGFPQTYYNYAYHCAGPRGLLDRLDEARELAASTIVTDGRNMIELTWRTDWTECSAVLDPDLNYQPVRFQQISTVPQPDRAAMLYERGTVTVTMDEYTKVDGLYFPEHVTKAWDLLLHDGSNLRASTQELWLESVKPNVPIEDGLFQIRFPPGTELSHNDYRVSTVVGALPKEAEAENVLREQDRGGNDDDTADSARWVSGGPSVDPNDSVRAHPPLANQSFSRGYLYGLAAAAAVFGLLIGYVRKAWRRG